MIDAMKQALEVLERASDAGYSIECEEAITALSQAIEQAEKQSGKCGCGANLYVDENGTPCSKAPTNREWIGLTDKEIFHADNAGQGLIEFARAIEAKLKEKNT
jgi:hypothetical protein